MFDMTVNLGNILVALTFIAGGLGFAYTIRSDVAIQSARMTLLQEANNTRLFALEQEIKTLRDVLVDMAKHGTRLDMMEAQLVELRTAVLRRE